MSADFSEDTLVEQPTISLFAELGYETANCWQEKVGVGQSSYGRETTQDVLLGHKLRSAIMRLNPDLNSDGVSLAIEELRKPRYAMSLVQANREVYKLLKEGVQVAFQNEAGEEVEETVRLIDWQQPENNDFFLASQMWFSGPMHKRRPDLVGFVNGLPLVFIELKGSHVKIEHAYQHNLKDYRETIPQLFWFNGLVILSNGSKARVGSVTAGWEHFSDWKRINNEGEQGVVSLETLIRGTCEKSRLLDLIENFTLFEEGERGLAKIVGKNHQYLGVNNAVNALEQIKENQGRLGVFWHTQGSGKSYSMAFFSQKVLRKIPGNWTFLVITDREQLDGQICDNFLDTNLLTELKESCQAQSGAHLRQLLSEDHRFIFTLIQKFGTKKGETYPKISDRSDIIVMTDEAHRSQYDTLALNMRNALPNAAFIGFTGTPLMAGEEKTKEVFGDYVSIYNFQQSIEDGATVPLFYENRIPELQLANENFKDDLEALIDAAELDENQLEKLERDLGREYHLITRDDRLEKVAEDIVSHFMGRKSGGKGMVICIDKVTTVKMYDKVQKYWKAYLGDLQARILVASEEEQPHLQKQIDYMLETDMAVIVSQQQNEIGLFKEKGLDIEKHRQRMIDEEMEIKFRDANDPFRLVFVCAMWLTGFDSPSVSTIYLDKPMKNHTLMQTIARANRVFKNKHSGLIVDYVGVFRNLQKALAIYGSSSGGNVKPGDCPIQKKEDLVAELRLAIAEVKDFCTKRGVDLDKVANANPAKYEMIAEQDNAAIKLVDAEAVDDAVEQVILNDDLKKEFISLANRVNTLYKAILPDPSAGEFAAVTGTLAVLAQKIRNFTPDANIEDIMNQVNSLLDASIATKGYVIHETEETSLIDLSQIDFEKLKAHFERGRKRTQAENLRKAVADKVNQMVALNKTRMDYLEKFNKLIEEYNKGLDVEAFFAKLTDFVKELNEEDKRAVSESLTEEELALFDLLTKPEMDMTKTERETVKKVARSLLQTLKEAKLVLDWRKKQEARAGVYSTVAKVLDELPRVYSKEIYDKKCETVFQHIYDSYQGEGRSIYTPA
ncbi:type I restriction endonuclease subunit R [Rubinisphaera brasiliensis]|uniref:Type I restriction enzyme endonuclease subunit n=1 Tax=Rubinisphaera brasiliensis (strain ATCC 49424 / DSM 5305 / JCM 21570 / IAM 15109 / NBRC 103401 / IFAM 1448) TaxID=756272 RepID=F0SQN8_RUBBR|nr:type I restriction endonuclease subunit R [Rubinisphaera brasiliensis]ADY59068.1 type I site-specific deoxyribonuclease, HsdR family [Rubinisphaera brasiliensis DSM 5305]